MTNIYFHLNKMTWIGKGGSLDGLDWKRWVGMDDIHVITIAATIGNFALGLDEIIKILHIHTL